MKRILWLITGLWLALPATAAEYIESYHSDIRVLRDGDLAVTETIVVNAEGNQIRRGIYRDFPTHYVDGRGRSVIVGFEVLEVRRDGRPEPFHIKRHRNGERIYIGHAEVFLEPGFYEYQIEYRTSRQLGFFDDFDELYYNAVGTGWAFQIDEATARVTLPDPVKDFRLSAYTGPQGSTDSHVVYHRSGPNQVLFETTQPLRPHHGLTIAIGWPKGIIEEPSAAQRRAWFYQDNKAEILVGGGSLVLLIYYLLVWRMAGKDPEGGVIVPLYRPPEGYSPASMRYVQNMGYDKKCFTAAVVNLAAKGALEIENDNDDFKLIRTGRSGVAMAPGELQIIRGLFSKGRDNLAIQQHNHSTLGNAISKHKSSLKRDYEVKYFNTNRLLLIPGFLATAALIIDAIASLPNEEIIMKTIFFGIFTLIPAIAIYQWARRIMRQGKKGIARYGILWVAVVGFTLFFLSYGVPLDQLAAEIPWWLVIGIAVMLLINYLFYEWLKAPTRVGRQLLDRVEGFKHYLSVAEEDEIAAADEPEFTTDLYESYLPYAIALDLENEWTARLHRAVASGLVTRGYSHPDWYHGRAEISSSFSTALSSNLDSAIASSSVAPGSSSGSSGGGSSGGGGGGGGGGGW